MSSTTLGQSSKRVEVLGLPIDCVTMDQCLSRIEEMIAGPDSNIVVTADASGAVIAQSDQEYADIVRRATLVTPDSNGVVWAANRQGAGLKERVTGVDIVERVCRLSADKGYRLVFLGSEPGVTDIAAENMRLRYPGCNIVGTRHGYFPSESDEVVAAEIAEFKPDVLFVAMGIPRQEKFIAKTLSIIKPKVAIGVGGSFDVFSGRAKRAPMVIQKLKLEWLWRTLLNPKKFSKAKTLPVFAWMVMRGK
ncbi:MAG TPA: WecB/TagA/CpsF family glycosyltransferase [Fimbriimonadaceae bacterium]|nr:WecB/TagA/CpsF family glycosyltransferase [Fimbriimonadaceae bacterium]